MRRFKNREMLRLKNMYNCSRWDPWAKLRAGAFGLSCISATRDGYPRAARSRKDKVQRRGWETVESKGLPGCARATTDPGEVG